MLKRLLAVTLVLFPIYAFCQASSGPSGHWRGEMDVHGKLEVALDIAKTPAGKWIGTVSTPLLGTNDVPLAQLVISGAVIRFIQNAPGAPSFAGTLSQDGAEITGRMSVGDRKIYLALRRTGEPRINLPPPSSQLTKSLEGSWSATIESSGSREHLVLKLSRSVDGSGSGVLINLDQKGVETALTTISQEGKQIAFEIRPLNCQFRGNVTKPDTIEGAWIQGSSTLPITFRRTKVSDNTTASLSSSWQAKIDHGGDYKVDFAIKFAKSRDGFMLGTLRTTDVQSGEMAVTNIIQNGRSVKFEIGPLKATFQGVLNASSTEIRGTWKQEPYLDYMEVVFHRQ